MTKKFKLSDSEKQLFQTAMQGAKKLKNTKVDPMGAVLPPNLKKKASPETIAISWDLSDNELFPTISSEDNLQFARSGIQYKILRQLRNGQYNVEARLDLHGKKVEEARTSLSTFLHRCQLQGLRHILIIHGKGRSETKPILKNKLNQWLQQINFVLAFHSAIPKDGGTGALYVLLKRGMR